MVISCAIEQMFSRPRLQNLSLQGLSRLGAIAREYSSQIAITSGHDLWEAHRCRRGRIKKQRHKSPQLKITRTRNLAKRISGNFFSAVRNSTSLKSSANPILVARLI